MSPVPRARSVRVAFMVALAALLSCLPGAGVPNLLPGEPAAAAPYCGTTLTKTDGTSWICTFADEFSGDTLDPVKWLAVTTAENGQTNAGECFVNSRNNIRVASGSLRLTVRKELFPITCKSPYGSFLTRYTSGNVATWNRFAQAYGRYEIRAKFPSTKTTGLHSALWLYPQSHKYGAWPASGEIDIAEFYTRYPDRVIPYLHYKRVLPDANVTNNYCMVTNPSAWHTYTFEWTRESMTIKYDGKVCLTTTAWFPDGLAMPAPFDHPYFINLTQALGRGHNPFSTTTTQLPGSTYVDYVRVWR